MDDLISKEAIEAFAEQFQKGILRTFPCVRPVVQCKNCKHFHQDVFGDELGIGKPYDCFIVAHEICDAWGSGCKTDPEGFCFMGEWREDD